MNFEIDLIKYWIARPKSINEQIYVIAGTLIGVVVVVKSASYLLKPRATENQGDIAKRGFNEERINGHYDTIVIGSGVGGMTTASILAQYGQKVLVLEQHDRLGGCTHTFKRTHKGNEGGPLISCEFDTGTHYTCLSMSKKSGRVGQILNYVTGGSVEWNDIGDPWDRLFVGSAVEDVPPDNGLTGHRTYDFVKTQKKIVPTVVARLMPISDNETADIINAREALTLRIDAFLTHCREIQKTIVPLFILRTLPKWIMDYMPSALANFKNASSQTTAHILTAFIDHNMTSEDILKGKPLPAWLNVKDPLFKFPNTRTRAKGVMVHPLGDYAVQPRDSSIMAHAMTMNYYVDGAAYTSGPTQSISRGAAVKILQKGGDCLVNCIVKEIIVKSNQATGVKVSKKGEDKLVEISASNVVNASGVYHLYKQLLPQSLPIVDQWKKEFKSIPSTGHIYLFVCLKGTPEKLNIPKTNLWYFNGYDTDKAFDRYFATKGLGIPPTVYLGFPCTKDPTWKDRFPDVSNCVLISDGKYEWFEEWENEKPEHRSESYEAYKAKIENVLLEILYDKIPETRGNVIWSECGTPLSDTWHLGSFRGGSYGTKCTPSYFCKDADKWLMRGDVPTISNLYQSGEDAWVPSVAGACYGGLIGATKVLGPLKSVGLMWNLFMGASVARRKEEGEGYIESMRNTFKSFSQ